MGTSKKIPGPSLSGLGKGMDRVPVAGIDKTGGGTAMHGGAKGRAPNAGTDYRDAGRFSIGAKDRRIANAPTDKKRD